jgi:hypothetical protein
MRTARKSQNMAAHKSQLGRVPAPPPLLPVVMDIPAPHICPPGRWMPTRGCCNGHSVAMMPCHQSLQWTHHVAMTCHLPFPPYPLQALPKVLVAMPTSLQWNLTLCPMPRCMVLWICFTLQIPSPHPPCMHHPQHVHQALARVLVVSPSSPQWTMACIQTPLCMMLSMGYQTYVPSYHSLPMHHLHHAHQAVMTHIPNPMHIILCLGFPTWATACQSPCMHHPHQEQHLLMMMMMVMMMI